MPFSTARKIFSEMLIALSEIHGLGFLLRDVTPDTFTLSSSGHIHLTDFDSVKLVVPNRSLSALAPSFRSSHLSEEQLHDDGKAAIDTSQERSQSSFSEPSDCRSKSTLSFTKHWYRHLMQPRISFLTSGSQLVGGSEISMAGSTDNDESFKSCHDENLYPKLGRAKSFVGTRSHLSPEHLNASYAGNGSYGFAADVWMLGVSLYIMVVGHHPFEAALQNSSHLFEAIKGMDVTIPDFVPQDIGDILRGMLQKDEKDRMTIEEIRLSPWLQEINWEEVRNSALDGVRITHAFRELSCFEAEDTLDYSNAPPDRCAISDVSRSSDEVIEIGLKTRKVEDRKSQSSGPGCGETLLGFRYSLQHRTGLY